MPKSNVYYLSGFNNYFNRRIKLVGFDADQMAPYQPYIIKTDVGVNFNFNDSVSTTHIANIPYDRIKDVNYVVVENLSVGDVETLSCWFVLESTKNLGGQYTLTLRRDLVHDNWSWLQNAPMYIEKAKLRSVTDNPFIFNKEGLNYNQIKKREQLLKDETGCAWIVGYCSPNAFDTAVTLTVSEQQQSYAPSPPLPYSTIASLANKKLSAINQVRGRLVGNVMYYQGSVVGSYQVGTWFAEFGPDGTIYSNRRALYSKVTATRWQYYDKDNWQSEMTEVTKQMGQKIGQQSTLFTGYLLNQAQAELNADTTTDYIDYSAYRTLLGMVGTWYNDNGTLFRITKTGGGNSISREYENIRSGEYFNALKSIVETFDDSTISVQGLASDTPSKVGIQVYTDDIQFSVEVNQQQIIKNEITSTVNTLSDAPYKMFAIPYTKPTCQLYVGSTNITSTIVGNFGPTLATQLATQLGSTSGYLYDIQLLPYCPLREFITTGKLTLSGTEGKDYTLMKNESQSGRIESFILWATKSSFNTRVEHTINVSLSDPMQFKVQHETEFQRLVSPNYTNVFEFKATSNYGVHAFEVNCTYKPYQPYIHVNPVFNSNGLYGGDYDDNRGLTCTGDYSLPVVTDAWTKYQIENKSYSDSFDRQIQNMDVINSVQRQREVITSSIGTVSSMISGFGTGTVMTGNPLAGVATGLTAGAISQAGARIDLELADRLRAEGLDYTRDMFNYNLQNIRALPNTLSKVSSFDVNSKLFPFVEFYSCTDDEKDALMMKLQYNGYTYNAINKLSEASSIDISGGDEEDTIGAYLKAQLINSGVTDVLEYHELAELASELLKGVFLFSN